MEINAREAVREAVARGVGLGAISETEYAPHEDIRLLSVVDMKAVVEAHVVCLAARRKRPLVDAFIRLAIDTAHAPPIGFAQRAHK